ncbi:helix-turn-helix transcriptional regulator [Glycocaulis abyssi]|uniref:Helix-turn-helix transcriptional regulator n=1 Tax=Glycocaulis abyssi TaxID=1433403 RepID=A0ABV9ND84_9PROT
MMTMLRIPEVMRVTGLSRPTIYARIQAGTFPSGVKLGERIVGWPESEIAAINAARIAGKSDDEIRVLVASLEARRAAMPV